MHIVVGYPARLLLHPGHYRVVCTTLCRMRLQHIGLSLVHHMKSTISLEIAGFGWKQHFENLVIKLTHGGSMSARSNTIRDDSKYKFKHCTILAHSLDAAKGGSLKIEHCVIPSPFWSIFVSSSAREVVISDTLFAHGHKCVWIADGYEQQPERLVKLQITKNQFHNIPGQQLVLNVDGEDERTHRLRDQCVIHGNVSTRDRNVVGSTYDSIGTFDPNTLYIYDRALPRN